MLPSVHTSARNPVSRCLLGWIDSNELPWMLPLPPWSPERKRVLRHLRRLSHRRSRARTVAQSVAWPLVACVKAWRSLGIFQPPSPSRLSALRETAIRWWLQVAHNLASGQLGPVCEWEIRRLQDRHPDTGTMIRSTFLPSWTDLVALALRAHTAAGDWLGIGWDLSLTRRGPTLVEANVNFAVPPFGPLGDLRYVKIMDTLSFSAR